MKQYTCFCKGWDHSPPHFYCKSRCKMYLTIPWWSRLQSGSQMFDCNCRFCDNYACTCFLHRCVVSHWNSYGTAWELPVCCSAKCRITRTLPVFYSVKWYYTKCSFSTLNLVWSAAQQSVTSPELYLSLKKRQQASRTQFRCRKLAAMSSDWALYRSMATDPVYAKFTMASNALQRNIHHIIKKINFLKSVRSKLHSRKMGWAFTAT